MDVGQPAPDFTLPQDGGADITLSTLQPKSVVLYFYPRDDTSGCTKQALAFSEHLRAFEAKGVLVFGISKDTVAKHGKFRAKHALSVPLLSDADTTVCETYGVWIEKKMYGKTFMGIERTTVLIDPTGIVRNIWRKVKVPGHAETVLDAVRAL